MLFPSAPRFSPAVTDVSPVREWVMPSVVPRRSYANGCVALPPGMPDSLEVSIVRSAEGTERTTAVIYGKRVFLIHYAFTPG
ncbi:hypothetical protein [Noviherbaspirillum denitrificans]|nr:hypothetical protein [Noviherbaspirillum denitrificans]